MSYRKYHLSPSARYLECANLARRIAHACCAKCGHNVLIAYFCKGRGVCPACNP